MRIYDETQEAVSILKQFRSISTSDAFTGQHELHEVLEILRRSPREQKKTNISYPSMKSEQNFGKTVSNSPIKSRTETPTETVADFFHRIVK